MKTTVTEIKIKMSDGFIFVIDINGIKINKRIHVKSNKTFEQNIESDLKIITNIWREAKKVIS